MSWFSLLPSHLTIIETWIIRFFLLLTLLTIGPWALFLLYDMILYLIRALLYEIPVVGGRAQGRQRPGKPTLENRPDGRKRTFSFAASPNAAVATVAAAVGLDTNSGGERTEDDDSDGSDGSGNSEVGGDEVGQSRRKLRKRTNGRRRDVVGGNLGDGDGIDVAVSD